MIPVGETYKPAGYFDIRAILTTLILGSVAAALAAGLIWLWEISPFPTLVIITAVIQGAIVGAAMTFVVGRMRLRSPFLAGVIGFACGLLSIALVHYGHYLHFPSVLREGIANDKDLPLQQRQLMLAKLNEDPMGIADRFLLAATGHKGFVGSLLLRNKMGVKLKSSTASGWFLWALWAGEAFFVAIVAAALASERAKRPFCEDCRRWCDKLPQGFTVRGSLADPLAEALRADDLAKIAALRAEPVVLDGSGEANTTLYACPECGQTFADLAHRVGEGNAQHTSHKLKPLRVSPEMVEALRGKPAATLEDIEPAAPQEPGDATTVG
jgi:hypothetical protein